MYLLLNLRDNSQYSKFSSLDTVGNLVLQLRAFWAIKPDFRPYIPPYTSTTNENFEYGYPHSNALLQFYLNFECYKPHKAACHQTKCDVINDMKPFLTVYRRIYCHKFLTLSNKTSRYKSNCIKIKVNFHENCYNIFDWTAQYYNIS